MKCTPYFLALLLFVATACGPAVTGPEFQRVDEEASTEIDCTVTNPPPECAEDGVIGSNTD